MNWSFKGWLDEARAELKRAKPDKRDSWIVAQLHEYEQLHLDPACAHTVDEVRGFLQEYCGALANGPFDVAAAVGDDLDEEIRRITELRAQLAQADSVRASNKYMEEAIHQIPDLGEDEDYQAAVKRVVRERERLRDEVKSYKQSIEAEFEGAVELRKKHGARSNETFSMFVDRLAGDREIYADEVRCLRKRLEGMAEKLGVSIDGVVGAVSSALNERSNLKQECDYLRQKVEASMKQSDGRRRALLELEAERRKDWQRAEMLAAHESVPGVVRDQLSEVIGSLMHVYVDNSEIKGLPEIVDDLRRVRDRMANMSSQEGGS